MIVQYIPFIIITGGFYRKEYWRTMQTCSYISIINIVVDVKIVLCILYNLILQSIYTPVYAAYSGFERPEVFFNVMLMNNGTLNSMPVLKPLFLLVLRQHFIHTL